MSIQPLQLIIGCLCGILVSFFAWKARSLTISGAAAAALLGAVIFGLGGPGWAVLLLGFFISSSGLSKLLQHRKADLNEKFSKGSQRDAGQVLANGGFAGIFALLHSFFPQSAVPWFAFAGALAAVNADTWATELGVLSPQIPRLITSAQKVERGTSGGITWYGTLAALGGALFIALLAIPFWGNFNLPTSPLLILAYTIFISLSGLFGSLVDSLLGATLQAIYYCPSCRKETERHPAHSCGNHTHQIRGWRWMDNDWVNAFCSLAGTLVAIFFIGQIPSTILFLFDIGLVLGFSLLLNAIFHWQNITGWFLSLYLLVYANIVLVVEAGGSFSLLNNRAFWIGLHAVLASLAFFFWLRAGKPSIFQPLHSFKVSLTGAKILEGFKKYPDMYILGLAVGLSLMTLGIANFYLPQYIDDVLTTYLARAGFWLQTGSFKPWPADLYQLAQIVYPLNAQAQIFWSLLFTRSDQLAGLSQWFALPVSMLAIYGLSRLLGASRSAGIFAALLFFAAQNVFIFGAIALTDLIAAALFSSMLYFLVLGCSTKQAGTLLSSGLAFGLVLGTKQTIVYTFPFLLIAFIFLHFKNQIPVKTWLHWGFWSFTSSLFLGTYAYWANWVYYGNPAGPPEMLQGFTRSGHINAWIDVFNRFVNNASLFFSDSFKFGLLDIKIGDANSVPGMLTIFLIFIAFFYAGFVFLKKNTRAYAAALGIISAGYLFALLAVRDYTGAEFRYMILGQAVLAPLIALFADKWFNLPYQTFKAGIKPKIFLVLRGLLVCAFIYPLVVFFNNGSVLLDSYKSFNGQKDFFSFIDQFVPQNGSLAIIKPGKYPVSLLFGQSYNRQLLPISSPPQNLTASYIKNMGADYLLMSTMLFDQNLVDPQEGTMKTRSAFGTIVYPHYHLSDLKANGFSVITSVKSYVLLKTSN